MRLNSIAILFHTSVRIAVTLEQCTSSMVTTRTEMEITRGLTYSVSRVIEVPHGNLTMLFVFFA